MKKLFVLALTAFLLAACGGGDTPDSLVKQAMREAEKTVPQEEFSHLGTLPVLWAKHDEAKKQLSAMISERKEKADEKFKKGGSMEDRIRSSMIIEDLEKASKTELERIFKERITAEATKLDGQSVPVDFDKGVFSDAKVTIHLSKDTSIYYPIVYDVDLTLAAPLRSKKSWWSWTYIEWESRDKNNEVLEYYIFGSQHLDNIDDYKEGDHVTFEIRPDVRHTNMENPRAFEKLYFCKKE